MAPRSGPIVDMLVANLATTSPASPICEVKELIMAEPAALDWSSSAPKIEPTAAPTFSPILSMNVFWSFSILVSSLYWSSRLATISS